jgi:hypothetical protein
MLESLGQDNTFPSTKDNTFPSECIRSRISLDLLLLLENGFLTFLPRAHPLQIPSCVDCSYGIPSTIFLRNGND